MIAKFEEILEALVAHGMLSKAEIVQTWALTEEEYVDLKRVFASQPHVEPGPKRTGGFHIKARRSAVPVSDAEPNAPIAGAAWEASTVARLCELLQYKDLEDMLGNLLYTVRQARKFATGEDRRGSKEELAHALIIKYGEDLFREGAVRDAVAKKCGVPSPGRWHPGKRLASEFVRSTGFPIELAGIPSEDPPEDFEYLEGRLDLKPLEDFQDDVKAQVVATLGLSRGRAIVTLPTGAGKTRVGVESIRDWLTDRHSMQDRKASCVLWLAHSGELCEQAYTGFRQVWQASSSVCPLLLFRFWGKHTQDFQEHRQALSDILQRPSVLVSTPQRIVNLLEDESSAAQKLIADILEVACLVVVDEAHRAASPSYTRILNALAASASSMPVIGLTATPFRTEYLNDGEAGTRELASLFGTLIESKRILGDNPREELQRRSILARPVVETVRTSTTLASPIVKDADSITDEEIESIDSALKIRADNPARRLAVFQPESCNAFVGPQ